ncbi:50S ribosomal protein L25/general stress protein Ctc [Longispora albida]|uniref:50S ribosomal protein L25/general stress protein Ctc n=1 Tax=Longispora albida TaxID=203523 RepID=UPI00036EBA45|nr:50S ribosomal protein L25/general stress protein Ctc [Longispora albida]
MSEVRISAEPRTEFGKGGARRTRRAGKIPAVLYGHGEAPKHIALPALEFAAAIRRGGINQLFSLEGADGTKTLALPKALQRDPIKDTIDHVDLLIVKQGEKVTVEVPVHVTGTAASGTLVSIEHTTLTLSAEATHLPDSVEVSIEGAEAGTHITAGQITLPKGAELGIDADALIVNVTASPTAADLEGEAPAEAAEAPAEA